MRQSKAWIHAARLRTLPLALSSVLMGTILAFADGYVHWGTMVLAVITTLLLQILSNFANDYGDYTSGVDVLGRVGPKRAIQGGLINPEQMKKAIIVIAILALVSGLALLLTATITPTGTLVLLCIGLLAILAAITYTVGKRPYGYVGLGDLSVFLFFGLVGVLGSHYVIHGQFYPRNFLLASSCGLFSVGVLNLNNIRDLAADKQHRKNTLPVYFGEKKAKIYHTVLISLGWILALVYGSNFYETWFQWIFLLSLPLFGYNVSALWARQEGNIDPLLRQLAISTLLFVILHGIGWWLS